jgi:hypothetical protein
MPVMNRQPPVNPRARSFQAIGGVPAGQEVTRPNYRAALSVSELSERGCAIESPGHVLSKRAWRCVSGHAIKETLWG